MRLQFSLARCLGDTRDAVVTIDQISQLTRLAHSDVILNRPKERGMNRMIRKAVNGKSSGRENLGAEFT